jgi:phage I-like protein
MNKNVTLAKSFTNHIDTISNLEHNNGMSKLFKINTPITLSENQDEMTPQKCQLMKTGVFGYFEPGDMVVSSEMFLSFVDNFNRKVRGTDLAIDYAHDSFKEAAGWIKGLSASDDRSELWADIEWTPKGKESIKNKEYRYLSAEFVYEYEDENGVKCGATLFGAGLTNRPFLKNMKPVSTLSEEQRIKKMDLEKKLSELESKQSKLEAALAEKEAEIVKLNEEKKQAEKDKEFNQMLLSGKACEAQRAAFIAGDIKKFAELAEPFKTNSVGHGDKATDATDKNDVTKLSADEAEEKIVSLAEEKAKKDSISFRDALKEVRKANPELTKKADSKFE